MRPIRYLLRLAAGASSTTDLVLRAGQPQPVLTVGAEGTWRVRADAVTAVHVLLAFNGTDLWVAGSPPAPAFLDGKRLEPRWIPVRRTAQLEIGRARIAILPRVARVAAVDDAGTDIPTQARTRPTPNRAVTRLARPPREEATALADPEVVEQLRAALRGPLVPPAG